MEVAHVHVSAPQVDAAPGPSSAMHEAGAAVVSQQASRARFEIGILRAKLKQVAQGLQPAIFRRRTQEAELLQGLGIRVLDWRDLKQAKQLPTAGLGMLPSSYPQSRTAPRSRNNQDNGGGSSAYHHATTAAPRSSAPKVSKAVKSKSNASGRTYTSRFRGVHQTFPTRRWEAQFRRNGKPTSLGCFDNEEEAAKAYDKMMLWCEMHNSTGVKGGITNFDASEYEKDIPWLQQCTQDELIESLRSEGRKQAAHRMMKHKREATHPTTDDDGPSGSVATAD